MRTILRNKESHSCLIPLAISDDSGDFISHDFVPLELLDSISQFYGTTLGLSDVEIVKTQGAIDTIEINFS